MYQGDYILGATVVFNFNTAAFSTGAPITLAGSPAVSVYKNSTTQSTSGITLTVDYDALTGMHHVVIDLSSDATFYAAGNDFDVIITAGTVGGTSVVGRKVGAFSVQNRVVNSVIGAVGSVTGAVGSVTGAVGSVTGNIGGIAGVTIPATIASPTNITAGTITTTTNLTNAPTAGDFTAAMKTSLNASTPASVTGAVGSVTGAVGSVTGNVGGSVGSVTGNLGGNVVGNVNGNVAGSVGSVTGAVGSVSGAVGSVTGNVGGNLVGNVNGNVSGSVGSVTGAVGSVTGSVGSVTGSVGSVVGAVGSVTGAVGSVSGNVGGDVSGKVLGGGAGTISGDGVRASSVTGAVGSVTGATGSVTGNVGGNVVGSVGSVTGAVGSVTGSIGSYVGNTPQTGDAFAFLGAAMPESYAADNVTPTMIQMLYQIWSALSEFAVSGTSITCYKLDGTTSAMVFTIDDATSPTLRHRTT